MTNDEKAEKIKKSLEGQDLYTCLSVDQANHNPHPYMVGPHHITYAADNHGGMLGEDAILAGEKVGKCKCAQPKCNTPYEDHTSDTIAFLQLLRHGTNDEANTVLKAAVTELGEAFVDGFAFVETEEKYRIEGDAVR